MIQKETRTLYNNLFREEFLTGFFSAKIFKTPSCIIENFLNIYLLFPTSPWYRSPKISAVL